ncbi:cysteine proteinase COT44 [Eutrema salsugineum]|uniref:cysteine proteinase COT44 n=1 Tax=Eutrema salsugineum TaxID=72664 RepID=UPI000CECECE1|nr:cysteine proteinase COT44 [Eutrema salsugineum]
MEFAHQINVNNKVHFYDIDGYETITDVDDVTLEDIVKMQPVVAILPLTEAFQKYGKNPNVRIYESVPDSLPSRGFHAVLLIGYGNHNGRPYWVVQNSWGSGWGFEGGFGYIYRQTKRGRRSVFTEVHYPTKKKRDRA